MQNKRVIVGLSGGVDSSVAAYLLQQQGYEVIGLFMKNWHDDSVTLSDDCPWLEDSNDAMLVAEKLGIPFQTVDLSKQYKERIVDYMFAEYQRGRTPNPDVLCNREIKFDVFLDIALSLGADYVATGHYCRKETVTSAGSATLLAKKVQGGSATSLLKTLILTRALRLSRALRLRALSLSKCLPTNYSQAQTQIKTSLIFYVSLAKRNLPEPCFLLVGCKRKKCVTLQLNKGW
jgi:tRNA U34 2-thiouridine synthase MnmA/TrmU